MATTVSSTSTTAANPFAQIGTKAAAAPASSATEDRFLALLMAQMKNQDPLNPLDNAQVTSQLAQISTVNGIEKLDATLKSVLQGNQELQTMQATSLVGHQVMAAGNGLTLASGSAVGAFELPDGADTVSVTIKSESGLAVHTEQLSLPNGVAAWPSGIHSFAWDGKTDAGAAAAEGNYTFEVKATSGKASAAAQALSISLVDGVTPGSTGVSVNTSRGTIDFANIKQVM
jgi:flagellar basal-body rod modification protein FlgD